MSKKSVFNTPQSRLAFKTGLIIYYNYMLQFERNKTTKMMVTSLFVFASNTSTVALVCNSAFFFFSLCAVRTLLCPEKVILK